MNNFICILLIIITSICLMQTVNGAEQFERGVNQENIFLKSSPINSGFVFIDGQYINSPYIVSRDYAKIYINGVKVFDYTAIVKEEPIVPKKLPIVPASINTQTDLFNKDLNEYLKETMLYYELNKKMTNKMIFKEMRKTYTNLPCVKMIENGKNPTKILVTFKNGRKQSINIAPVRRKARITTKTANMYFSNICQHYVNQLENGCLYSISNRGNRIHSMDSRQAKNTINSLFKCLNSDKSNKQKETEIRSILGLSGSKKLELPSDYVGKLKSSEQLNQRTIQLNSKKQ